MRKDFWNDMQIRSILRESMLFSGLEGAPLADALRFFHASAQQYPQGGILQRAGTPMTRFGLVLTGVVRVYMYDINGCEMILANVTGGQTFGESLCFLQQQEAPVEVCAAEDVELLWMQADAVRLPEKNALSLECKNRFLAMLASRTLQMNNRIQILSRNTLRGKLNAFFTECAQENGSRTFLVPFDRGSLATYLGTDRSALSRELSRMRADGLIDYYKNSFRLLTPH